MEPVPVGVNIDLSKVLLSIDILTGSKFYFIPFVPPTLAFLEDNDLPFLSSELSSLFNIY